MTHHGRNRTRHAVSGAVTVVLLSIAGCGGDDDAAGTDTGSDVAAQSSDESTGGDGGSSGGSDGGGSGAAGDFPIPAPDGLVLDALADAGIPMDSQRQLFYENDDFDRVVAFYDDWTSQNGEWSRAEAEGSVAYQDISGNALQAITISPDHDPGARADGPVTIVLLVTDQ